MRFLANAFAAIGVLVTLLWLAGTFGLGDFRLIYEAPGVSAEVACRK